MPPEPELPISISPCPECGVLVTSRLSLTIQHGLQVRPLCPTCNDEHLAFEQEERLQLMRLKPRGNPRPTEPSER